MPINATLGSTLVFTVTFFTSAGVLTVPTSATLTVTYPPSSNSLTTASCAIGMTQSGSFFTATWQTAVAALGISSISISGAGQASPTTTQVRLTT
jgi:hypothetical protein